MFALGTLAKTCLFGANPKVDGPIPSPALQLLVARATSENSVERYENLDALVSELKAVNWSALNSAPKSAAEHTTRDRDELLRDIGDFTVPQKSSLWDRLLGRRAA